MRSCTKYQNGMGNIDSNREPKKVAFMFDKSIKLLVSSIHSNSITNIKEAVLITKNGEV